LAPKFSYNLAQRLKFFLHIKQKRAINDIHNGKSFSMDLSGYKAIPKPSSNRDIYTAVKVYITFLKGFYAHPEHSGASNTHTRITGASLTHTQSALRGIKYAHPDHRGVTYAHPVRTLGRHIHTPRAHSKASQIKYYNNRIPYTMAS
jgi:hypothetical protein